MITALSRRHALALGAVLLLGAPAAAQAQTTLLNVSYDPDARALPGVQRRLRQALEGEDRRDA